MAAPITAGAIAKRMLGETEEEAGKSSGSFIQSGGDKKKKSKQCNDRITTKVKRKREYGAGRIVETEEVKGKSKANQNAENDQSISSFPPRPTLRSYLCKLCGCVIYVVSADI